MKFMFLIFYSVACTGQLSVPSFYGSSLTITSEGFPYEIFKSSWMNKTKEFKRMMMILVERTLRPVALRIGGVFGLNLMTMLKVMEYFF